MSNDLEGKNILFYSESPNDTLSKEILKILKESPLLNEQFYKFSINNQKLKIPELIKRTGVIPVIAISGFNDLIKGPEALKWIKGNCLSNTKNSDYEYVDVTKNSGSSSDFSSIGDTFKRSSASQPHNMEFNKGTEYADSSYYASLDGGNRIETYDEQNLNKSDSDRLFNTFKNSRQREIKNINSQAQNEMNLFENSTRNFDQQEHFMQHQMNQMNQMNQPSQITYNPYMNSNPNEQQEREKKFQQFLKQEDHASSSNYVNRQFQNVYNSQQQPFVNNQQQSQMTRSRHYNPQTPSRDFPSFNNPSSQSSNITPFSSGDYASW